MFNPAFWWALAGIALMICEFAVPGLILFFFGLGALFTALLAWLIPMSLSVQLSVFAASSLVSLFGLRRMLKSVFAGRTAAETGDDPADGLMGADASVHSAIAPGRPGKVMLNGTVWKAESEEALEEGCRVEVAGQKSLTLIVKRK